MAKWDKRFNPPPIRSNKNLERMGPKVDCVERIVTTYIETGRSVRSLAGLYGCSKSTIGRYINEYAQQEAPHYLYQMARDQAAHNRGQGAEDTDDVGRYD